MEGSGEQLKCISCRVIFNELEELKDHFRSELHRFNLKRKVLNLPPVTQQVFDKKIAAEAAKLQETDKTEFYCKGCKKSLGSRNTYEQHLRSKAHERKEAKNRKRQEANNVREKGEPGMGEGGEMVNQDEMQSDEKDKGKCCAQEEDAPSGDDATTPTTLSTSPAADGAEKSTPTHSVKECVFCNHRSRSLEKNVSHMAAEHGLFIPDVEYLVDVQGFVQYLIERITELNVCLYCRPFRQFSSTNAVQDHMRSVGHCKLRYEEDVDQAEVEEFYDFSMTYEAYVEKLVEADGNGVAGEVAEDATGGEGTSEESALALYDDTGEKIDPIILSLEKQARERIKLADHGHELHVNGKIIGHRDYAVYYAQRSRPHQPRVVKHYKALGYKTKTREEFHTIRAKRLERAQKHHMQLGVKGNKLFKPRLQVLF
mmetsp:Transcript_2460/g.6876  ORF Transcript_2460/g.6876 Transcript_2460/m.6876 type:complete len:427 (+) Transcript_2460:101-1381(+)